MHVGDVIACKIAAVDTVHDIYDVAGLHVFGPGVGKVQVQIAAGIVRCGDLHRVVPGMDQGQIVFRDAGELRKWLCVDAAGDGCILVVSVVISRKCSLPFERIGYLGGAVCSSAQLIVATALHVAIARSMLLRRDRYLTLVGRPYARVDE